MFLESIDDPKVQKCVEVLLGLLLLAQSEISSVGNGVVKAIDAKALLPKPMALLSQAGKENVIRRSRSHELPELSESARCEIRSSDTTSDLQSLSKRDRQLFQSSKGN